MNWVQIKSASELDNIDEESNQSPVIIFKHSTRCGTSLLVHQRLLRSWDDKDMKAIKTYFVNVISDRELSQRIMHRYNIYHQSPQILIISKGACIYNESHFGIEYEEVKKQIHHLAPQ